MSRKFKCIWATMVLALCFVCSACSRAGNPDATVLYYTEENNSLNYSVLSNKKSDNISFVSDKPCQAAASPDGNYIYYLCCYDGQYESGGTLFRISTNNSADSKGIIPEYISESVLNFDFDNNGGVYCFKYNTSLDKSTISYYFDGNEKEILSGSWIDYDWYCDAERTVMYVCCDNAWYRAVMSTNPKFQYVCHAVSSLSPWCHVQQKEDYQTLVDNDMMIELGFEGGYETATLYKNGILNRRLTELVLSGIRPFGIEVIDGDLQFYYVNTVDGQRNEVVDSDGYLVGFTEVQWSLYHYENAKCVECSESLRFTSEEGGCLFLSDFNGFIYEKDCYVLENEIITLNADGSLTRIAKTANGEYKISAVENGNRNMDDSDFYIMKNQDGRKYLLCEYYPTGSHAEHIDLYFIVNGECSEIDKDIKAPEYFVNNQESVFAWCSTENNVINYICIHNLEIDKINDSIKKVVGVSEDLYDYCYCGYGRFLLKDRNGLYCNNEKTSDLLVGGYQSLIIYSNGWYVCYNDQSEGSALRHFP